MRSLHRYVCEDNKVKNVLAINHCEVASVRCILDEIHVIFIRQFDISVHTHASYTKNYIRKFRDYASPSDMYCMENQYLQINEFADLFADGNDIKIVCTTVPYRPARTIFRV